MTNEQAALIAAASYLGPPLTAESNAAHALKICSLAKELLNVLDWGTLVEPRG